MNELNEKQLNTITDLIASGNHTYANKVAMHFLGVITLEKAREVMSDTYGVVIKKTWNNEASKC